MSSSAANSLPQRDRTGTWFADERGIERRLKVSWHPERRVLVLSLWQGDTCTATFRLSAADLPRLVTALVDALGQAAAHPTSGSSGAALPSWLARFWRREGPPSR